MHSCERKRTTQEINILMTASHNNFWVEENAQLQLTGIIAITPGQLRHLLAVNAEHSHEVQDKFVRVRIRDPMQREAQIPENGIFRVQQCLDPRGVRPPAGGHGLGAANHVFLLRFGQRRRRVRLAVCGAVRVQSGVVVDAQPASPVEVREGQDDAPDRPRLLLHFPGQQRAANGHFPDAVLFAKQKIQLLSKEISTCCVTLFFFQTHLFQRNAMVHAVKNRARRGIGGGRQAKECGRIKKKRGAMKAVKPFERRRDVIVGRGRGGERG